MKTNILILCALLIQQTIFAQTRELGLAVFQFSNQYNESEENFYPSSIHNDLRSNTLIVKPLLQYTVVRANQIELTIQYGFMPISIKSNNEYDLNGTTNEQSYKSTYSRKSHTLRLGIGKRNYWNKFILSSMLYLPFEYTYGIESSYKIKTYNEFDELIANRSSTRSEPNYFSAQMALAQAAYYPICKKLYIGAELDFGLSGNLTFGTARQQDLQIEQGVLTSNSTSSYKRKSVALNTFFSTALCLKYQLSHK